MQKWKEYKLDQIARLVKDTFKPNAEESLPYIGLEHIEEQQLRLNSVGHSSEVISNKFYFQPNDVLFGKLRPYFKKVVQPKFKGVCSTDIWVLRAKEGFDQDFLYYFVANKDFVDLSNNADTGTRMPRADWDFMKETEWFLPESKEEQKKIASTLKCLDNKIELLTQNNFSIEEYAKTLFKQWFVVEATDWEISTVDYAVSVKGGTTPSTEVPEFWNGDIAWTSPRDLSKRKCVFLNRTDRTITEKGLRQIGSGLLPIGTVLLSSRAPIGYITITEVPVAINQGYIAVICDKGFSNYYIFLWLKKNLASIITASNGSTFDEISRSVFKELDFVIPPPKRLEEFDKIVKPLFDKIKNNELQIQNLQNLRDTYLSKLMSGEARVKM